MSNFFGELLVALVSKFLSPLRFPREYHDALEELGRQDWTELKSSLSGPDATQVLPLLQAFLEARRADNQARQDYIQGLTDHEPWDEAYEIMRQKYHALVVAIDR
jgi:hypothetical protein